MSEQSKELYEKSVDLFVAGKHDEAIAVLLDLIKKDPKYADAYESLGMLYFKGGNLDKAIEWTEKLAALKPDHAMAHTNLSIFYMKKGNKEKAEEEKAKATVLSFGKISQDRK